MQIDRVKFICMTVLTVMFSLSIQGNAREFDQQYLKWKAEQDAKDAQFNIAQPNHYLSKPYISKPSTQNNHTSLSQSQPAGSTVKIKLNTASVSQLQQLNGVGEKKALAIIEYRQQHGGFKTIDELNNVKGIGPKLLEKNKARLAL